MLFEEVLDGVSVNDAFNNLITKLILEAVTVAEVAGLASSLSDTR